MYPALIPLILFGLSRCSSDPQNNNVFVIPGRDGGPTGDLANNDQVAEGGDTARVEDAFVGPDLIADAVDLPTPEDAMVLPDTPIDIPPQPKLCTSQLSLPPNSPIKQLFAGESASGAVTATNEIKAWGKITVEELSKTQVIFSSPTPKTLDGFKNVIHASMYLQHLIACDTFGVVRGIGQNSWAQLGNGKKQSYSATPVVAQGALDIMQVATGSFHSCGLTTKGAVLCWGYNVNGQVGLGEKAASWVLTPKEVTFTPPTPINTIAAGSFHTAGIHESGAFFGWGHNGVKQLGLAASGAKVYAPTFIDKAAYRYAGGDDFSCIVNKDCIGGCTGSGGMGQLGIGSTESKSAFTAVKSLSGISTLSANRQHVCAVTQGGELYCWGDGVNKPTLIKTPAPVVLIAVGAQHVLFADIKGEVYAFGDNSAGQLGDGTSKSSSTPVKVKF